MVIHEGNGFKIYFGDDASSIKQANISLRGGIEDALPNLQGKLNTKSLVFLNQVHGTNGITISEDYKLSCPLDIPTINGDIILTDLSEVGLGVLTADCLPIILFDNDKRTLAIAHAGWKGSVLGIAKRTINMMKERFKSQPKNMEVYLGPSAKECCYEVHLDFMDHLKNRKIDPGHFVMDRLDKLFFDNVTFNKHQLLETGIKEDNIYMVYNHCTVCNLNYCSVRRNKDANRQVTIAVIDK